MQIYKTFLRLSLRNIGPCILYLAMLALFATAISESESSFNITKLSVAVIDNDHSTLSETLYDYIDEQHKIKEIGDKDQWADYIFYHNVEYILVINEGFEESMLSGNSENLLTSYQAPDSNSSYIVESQVNTFVNNVSLYLSAGYDLETACSKSAVTSKVATNVTFSSKDNDNGFSSMNYYFNFLSYSMICIFITSVGLMIVIFNKPELKARTNISCVSFTKRNAGVIGAMFTYTIGIFIILMAFASALFHKEFLCQKGLYYGINAAVYMLVCLAVTFLVAQFSRKTSVLTIWSNIIGLSTSFICGIFVPREVLPEKVLHFSKCLPTYWYVNVTEEIKHINGSLSSSAYRSMLIQILFALAIFSIGLAVVKLRQQKAE